MARLQLGRSTIAANVTDECPRSLQKKHSISTSRSGIRVQLRTLGRRKLLHHQPCRSLLAYLVPMVLLAGCTLTVRTLGDGIGNVSSSPGGINCGGGGMDCSETSLRPTALTLKTTAGNGSIFTGWGGACSGTGSCSVTLDGNKTVLAYFQTALAAGSKFLTYEGSALE